MFNRLNTSVYVSLLHDVCGVCDRLLVLPLDDADAIEAFIDDSYLFKQNVLSLFSRALALDYLALRTQRQTFFERATVAYTQAITSFHNNPEFFTNFQRAYAWMRSEMSNEYKNKLFTFLEPIALLSQGDSAEELLAKLPPVEKIFQVIQELSINLHRLEGDAVKEAAEKLIKETADFLSARSSQSALSLPDLFPLRMHIDRLYQAICYQNDYCAIQHVTNRLARMNLGGHEYDPAIGRRMNHPWLIHDLLIADNVSQFIFALIRTLPEENMLPAGMKRGSAESGDAMATAPTEDAATIFQRRIVRAQRRAAVLPVPAPAPAPEQEVEDVDTQQLEEDLVDRQLKHSRF